MTKYRAAKQDGIQINCQQKRLILKDLKEMKPKISVNKFSQMKYGKDVKGTYRLCLILFQILKQD